MVVEGPNFSPPVDIAPAPMSSISEAGVAGGLPAQVGGVDITPIPGAPAMEALPKVQEIGGQEVASSLQIDKALEKPITSLNGALKDIATNGGSTEKASDALTAFVNESDTEISPPGGQGGEPAVDSSAPQASTQIEGAGGTVQPSSPEDQASAPEGEAPSTGTAELPAADSPAAAAPEIVDQGSTSADSAPQASTAEGGQADTQDGNENATLPEGAVEAPQSDAARLAELKKMAQSGELKPTDRETYAEFKNLRAQEDEFKRMDAQFKDGTLDSDSETLTKYQKLKEEFGEKPKGEDTGEDQAENQGERVDTRSEVDKLNESDENVVDQMGRGEITRQEARRIMAENRERRTKLVDALVQRLDSGDKGLTKFEQEVAEAGQRVRQSAYQVMAAPRIIEALEKQLKTVGAKFDATQGTQLSNENLTKNQKNLAERDALGNQIAYLSTEIARYSIITKTAYDEFLAANNQLDSLVGQRNGLKFFVVAAYASVMKRAHSVGLDAKTRQVAKKRAA